LLPAPAFADIAPDSPPYWPIQTMPFNVTGNPAMSIPTGFSASGLPLSMQIVGRPFDDATVLRVAHAYEDATPWRARRPVLEPNAAVSTALPPIPDPALPEIGAARRDEIAAACRRAGLTLSERYFQQLCATAPYVEAMVGRLRRDPEFYEEPASIVCFSDAFN
jgi:aspartyl-tRNA(Asn)/glutamyl-tRNA(Gln) amidotransferase subunit A